MLLISAKNEKKTPFLSYSMALFYIKRRMLPVFQFKSSDWGYDSDSKINII